MEIHLSFDDTGKLIDGVLDGKLDIAFTQFVEALPPELTANMLACDPLVFACPSNHELAGRQNLTLGDIAQQTFIDLPLGHGTRQLVDHSFAEAGLRRKSEFTVNDLTMQLDMVAHGLGVALVPQLVVQGRAREGLHAQLGFASLAEPEACWELAVVFSKNLQNNRINHAAANACLDMLLASHPG